MKLLALIILFTFPVPCLSYAASSPIAIEKNIENARTLKVFRFEPVANDIEKALIYYPDDLPAGRSAVSDAFAKKLAKKAHAIVIVPQFNKSSDERKRDAFNVYTWALNHANEWKIDKRLIAVGGEGSGANLAVHVALKARDTRIQLPAHMVLINPLVNGKNESYDNLLSFNYSGSSCATIVTSGLDPLKKDGKYFADKLRSSKVPLLYLNYENEAHGFFEDNEKAQNQVVSHLLMAYGEAKKGKILAVMKGSDFND